MDKKSKIINTLYYSWDLWVSSQRRRDTVRRF